MHSQTIEWIRQFGSGSTDYANAVATDATGVYVAGFVRTALSGQTYSGAIDAFVRKYDQNGNELWTRQFGTAGDDEVTGVTVDPTGIIVVGTVGGSLPGQTSAGNSDAYVRKYDLNGNDIWTSQFGTTSIDGAREVTTDSTGIYVGGYTLGALPGQTSFRGYDAFVRKFDINGNEQWTQQFGSFGNEYANGIAVDVTGVYVVGSTSYELPGQTRMSSAPGTIDAYIRKYDSDGAELWTRQFGSIANDEAWAVAISNGAVYVVGEAINALPGQTITDGGAFLRKYDGSGTELWTRQFGPISRDVAFGVSADTSGIYITGYTSGSLSGQTYNGNTDVFAQKYDHEGVEQWTRQFGTSSNDHGHGIAVDGNGGVYVVGYIRGALQGQINIGVEDAFIVKFTTISSLPALNYGGIVNNASYDLAGTSVAPGGIAAVFGTNLTDGSSCVPPSCNPVFEAGRLKTTMAGASVKVNEIPAPIFYALPLQLGIQIPVEVSGSTAAIAVTVGSQTSAAQNVALEPLAPGIFTFTGNGLGAGAITHADGVAVTAQNPAHPNEVVIVYATGLGQTTPGVATGALPSGLTETVTRPAVRIDGIDAEVQFSGLSGCCVGLNQINVKIPAATRTGNDIPVVLTIGGKQANAVTIAVAP